MDENLLLELSQPFPPSQIEWQVGRISQDQTKALALAAAPLRAYLNRLDAVCGLAWSVTYTPWAGAHWARLVCHLTIHGVTRSSTGEPDSQSVRNECGGTAAEAQAFKRACALFGLGRDLDTLPSAWVEYDPATQQFTAAAQAHLASLLGQPPPVMPEGQSAPAGKVEPEGKRAQAAKPNSTTLDHRQPLAQDRVAPVPASHADAALEALRTLFDEAGHDLYGEQWAQVSQHNIARITGRQGQQVVDLTEEQLQKLIDGMRQLKQKRMGKSSEASATPSV